MTLKYRISGLAIASLVFGMLFFIPLISAVLATVFGIKAYFSIRNSDGYILGKNVAISGIVLGGIQLFVWCMVFFSGLFYIVEQNQQAVVTQSGKVVRESYPGFHTKIPFMEKVYFYPKDNIFNFNIEPDKFLLRSKTPVLISIGVRWQVCNPVSMYRAFNGTFDQSNIQLIVSQVLRDKFRLEVYKYNNAADLANSDDIVKELYTDKYKGLFEESSLQLREKFGICLVAFDNESYFKLAW